MQRYLINNYDTETIIMQKNVDYYLQMVNVDREMYTLFYISSVDHRSQSHWKGQQTLRITKKCVKKSVEIKLTSDGTIGYYDFSLSSLLSLSYLVNSEWIYWPVIASLSWSLASVTGLNRRKSSVEMYEIKYLHSTRARQSSHGLGSLMNSPHTILYRCAPGNCNSGWCCEAYWCQ